MKKLILLLGICLIFLNCGPKLNDAAAAAVIQEALELVEEDTLEILGISMESKDIALVEFKLNEDEISSKMRRDDKGWQLDKIKNDFGMWVSAENLTKTVKLVGVRALVSADEFFKGKIEKMDFAGTVIVELKDGTKVGAICDKEIWSKLRGGQMLKIARVDSNVWKVVEIVKTRKKEKQ